jgi:hypothetical protein
MTQRSSHRRPIALAMPNVSNGTLAGRVALGLALILVLVLITLHTSAGTGFA